MALPILDTRHSVQAECSHPNSPRMRWRLSENYDKGSRGWAGHRAVLAKRLGRVREEFYGEHGEPILAEVLGLPTPTWENYESGVAIPGHILTHMLDVTDVKPHWLLRGEGPMFRASPDGDARRFPRKASMQDEGRERG